MAARPNILPLIDRTLSNVVDWEISPLQYTGYQAGQVVKSATHNTTGLLGALWNGYLDYGTVRTDDYIAAITQRWSATQLAYTVGAEILTLGAGVDDYATYFVDGYRIEIDAGLLRPSGAYPLLQPGATLPGRVWIYLDYGVIADPAQPIAAIRVGLAGVGAAATPGAGELPLVGVDVNALGVITSNTYDGGDPTQGLFYSATMLQGFMGDVIIAGDLEVNGAGLFTTTLDVTGITTLTGDANVIAELDVTSAGTFHGGLAVEGLITEFGKTATLVVDGDAVVEGELDVITLDVLGNAEVSGHTDVVTIDSSGLATLDSATITNVLTASGDVLLGTDGGNAIDVNSPMLILGSVGGSLSSDPTATLEWNGLAEFNGRLNVATGTSTAEGDLSKDGSGNFRYRDASATRFVHTSAPGWVKGLGQSSTLGAAAASLTLDTAVAVAPKATADLDVEASCWVSRAIAGAVTISLDEVGGLGQIGTSGTFTVPATAGTTYAQINFSRIRTSATTTPRIFRLTIAGGGSNVTVINARISVTPTS